MLACSGKRSITELERRNEMLKNQRDEAWKQLDEMLEQVQGKQKASKEWRERAQTASPGVIHVRSSGLAWNYSNPPFTGTGHGDGIARFKLQGVVVDAKTKKPVAKVQIIELPSRQFGGVPKEHVAVTSRANGSFACDACVGAAFQTGGPTPGAIYQSANKKYKIVHPHYQGLEISIGYGCPALKIYLQPK